MPPGFEDLDEPQQIEVDVFYGGYYLTSVPARFTSVEITIQDVDPLLSRLNALKDPQAARDLLTSPFYHNAEKICRKGSSPDCGRIMPEAVDVIFDRSRLRMDLFIAPALLKTRTLASRRFSRLKPTPQTFANTN